VNRAAVIASVDENQSYGHSIGMRFLTTYEYGATLSEKMRLTALGRLGIGTTSPQQMLHVNGNIQADGLVASRVLVSGTSGLIASSSVTSSELNFLSGVTSSVQSQLNSKLTNGSNISVQDLTLTGNISKGSPLLLSLYGTSSLLSGSLFYINNALNNTGFYVNYLGAYGSHSDRRMKENIEILQRDDAVAFVKNVAPVRYGFRSDPHDEQIGFIAQDVLSAAAHVTTTSAYRSIVPNHATPDPDEMLILSEHKLIAPLTTVVQDLLRRVESLESLTHDGHIL